MKRVLLLSLIGLGLFGSGFWGGSKYRQGIAAGDTARAQFSLALVLGTEAPLPPRSFFSGGPV
jgi:hypothetical protein